MVVGSCIVILLPGLGRSQSLVWNSDSVSNFSFTATGTGNSFSPASPITSPSGIWNFNGTISLVPNTHGPGSLQLFGGGPVNYTPGGLRYQGAPGFPGLGTNINTTVLFQQLAFFTSLHLAYWTTPQTFPFEFGLGTDLNPVDGAFGYPDNEHFLYSRGISALMDFTIISAPNLDDPSTWNWSLLASGRADIIASFTVPEPSSVTLLLLGALLCLRRRPLCGC